MNINKQKMKKILPLIVIFFSILIATVLTISKKDKPKQEIQKFIPNIKSLLMKPQDFTIYIESEGHIKSKTEFPLLSEVAGEILFLNDYFNNNLIFQQGDTLVKIDSSNYSIARRNAKASLDLAKLENLRQKAIYDRSQNELDQYNYNDVTDLAKKIPQLQSSESSFDAAKANYEKTELDIRKTIILAPFQGRVKHNRSSKGMHVQPGMQLATIYSTENMFVKLPLSIEDVSLLGLKKDKHLIESQNIAIDLETLIGDKTHFMKGKYMGVSGSVDKMTQKIYLNVSINNFSNKGFIVDDNLFINAKIYGKAYKKVFLVPNGAIIEDKYIHIIKDQKLYKRRVQILKRYDDYSIVDKGLFSGDIINLTRLDYYIEGMDIKDIK